jgi:hypothetical protein
MNSSEVGGVYNENKMLHLLQQTVLYTLLTEEVWNSLHRAERMKAVIPPLLVPPASLIMSSNRSSFKFTRSNATNPIWNKIGPCGDRVQQIQPWV